MTTASQAFADTLPHVSDRTLDHIAKQKWDAYREHRDELHALVIEQIVRRVRRELPDVTALKLDESDQPGSDSYVLVSLITPAGTVELENADLADDAYDTFTDDIAVLLMDLGALDDHDGSEFLRFEDRMMVRVWR